MRIVISDSIEALGPDAVLAFPFASGTKLEQFPEIASLGSEAFSRAIQRDEVRTTRYSTTLFHGNGTRPSLLLVGAGDDTATDPVVMMRMASAASRYLT